ncbi:MAG: thermonuclease family protein [candidate division Zixibacteria bacterium]|nr:thermonuclease family protein [candidate division Zixibacteria bacterium]
MKKYRLIALFVVIAIIIALRFAGYSDNNPETGDIVIRVIDGDTFELKGRGKVRLLFIDTPEKGEPYYDSALIYLRKTVLGQKVNLEFGHRTRDKYGRLLAFAYLDTILINEELIRRGYANLYLFPDNLKNTKMLNRLLAIQKNSVRNLTGIWSLPYLEEDQYIANTRSKRFHRPDCRSAAKLSESRKRIFLKRENAFLEGYSPCRNCKP